MSITFAALSSLKLVSQTLISPGLTVLTQWPDVSGNLVSLLLTTMKATSRSLSHPLVYSVLLRCRRHILSSLSRSLEAPFQKLESSDTPRSSFEGKGCVELMAKEQLSLKFFFTHFQLLTIFHPKCQGRV